MLAFDAQQKPIHTFFKLTSFTKDLLWVTLAGLSQFISSY